MKKTSVLTATCLCALLGACCVASPRADLGGFPPAHLERILHWEGVDNGRGNGGDILRRIGTNNISKAYAIDCGFTHEDIAKFRGIMLEQ